MKRFPLYLALSIVLASCGGGETQKQSSSAISFSKESSSAQQSSNRHSDQHVSSSEALSYSSATSSTSVPDTPNVFEKVNRLLGRPYSGIDLSFHTEKSGLSLDSHYVLQKKDDGYTLSFEEERYSALDLDAPTQDAKTLNKGLASYSSSLEFIRFIEGTTTFNIGWMALDRYKISDSDFSISQSNENSLTGILRKPEAINNLAESASMTYVFESDSISTIDISFIDSKEYHQSLRYFLSI